MDPSKFTFKSKNDAPSEKISFADLVAKSVAGAAPNPQKPLSFPFAAPSTDSKFAQKATTAEESKRGPTFGQSQFQRKFESSSNHPNFGQTFHDRKKLQEEKLSAAPPVTNPFAASKSIGKSEGAHTNYGQIQEKKLLESFGLFSKDNPFEAARTMTKSEGAHPNFGQTHLERKKLSEASSTLPKINPFEAARMMVKSEGAHLDRKPLIETALQAPSLAETISRKRVKTQPYEAKGPNNLGDRLTKRPIYDTSKFKFVRKADAPPATTQGTDETDENPFMERKTLKTVGSAPNLDNNKMPEEKLWKPKISHQSRIDQIKTRESSAPRSFSPESKDDAKLIKKLAELEGRECSGEYEKYSVLDERDKILYQLREMNSPVIERLERCEEMCTEKERYMRIVQKRSSPFECDEATSEVAHQMMIKEYARSAADQERPLPHELRSQKMMEHTMSYLLHSVLDKFPETAEQRTGWYNFLWSRTRAVRKEVTQLSMSDPLAIELVERCTRLHILFGYILCDLEVEHFDQKMNNENLGKCLQTLRHLYEDFERRGIKCPNEPEFRSYDVMMHMNDSNVFSQVLSYRPEVRQSEAVCLALQLSISFQNNNYCKFFRLLKHRATFLQCCMSHKFFNEIRSNAINVITSSYGRNAGYPLDKFCSLLAFDSIDDVKTAMEIYGLRVDIDADHVVLNRDYLTLNDPIPIRPYEWIDKKKNGKFSQVVYGPTTFHFFATFRDVSNSFDHHNLYTKDPVLRTILGNHVVVAQPSKPLPVQPNPLEVTIEQKRRMDEAKKINMLIQGMISNVIDQIVFGIVEEERMKEGMKRKMEKERRRKEEEERTRVEDLRKMRAMEERIAGRIQEKLERKIADDILQTVILTEICVEREKREKKLAKKMADELWEKKILKVVDGQVMKICVELIEQQNQISSGLENFKQNITRQWLSQFWNRWRECVAWKKELRTRKLDKIKQCLPKWENVQETNLIHKYGGEERKERIFNPNEAETFVRLKIIEKRRKNRIARKVLEKWRRFAVERRELRQMATRLCRKEDEFFKKFGKLEILRKRTFKFENPEEIVVKKRERKPLKESQSFSAFEPSTSMNTSINEADLTVAREQIETWKHDGMPKELKEKLKRRRESFEKEQNEHTLKKNKQEELMIGEVKIQTSKMDKMSEEAAKLLEDTKNFEIEMRNFMSNLKMRRVSQL